MTNRSHHPVTGLAAALAVVLAGGAVWSFAALMLRNDSPWLVLPMALVAAWGSGQFGLSARVARGVAATVLMLLGTAYAQWLIAANVVAAMLGLGFGDVLTRMDPEMTFALVRERAGPWSLALLAGGLVLAAMLAVRNRPHADT